MKRFLLPALLALATATSVQAGSHGKNRQQPRELSAPIVRLTPVIKKNADALELTTEQRADLQGWLSTMPAKRKALEAEALQARAALRSAILTGAPEAERAALAQRVGDYEVKLVTMRGKCVDHWRAVLNADQFAQALSILQGK